MAPGNKERPTGPTGTIPKTKVRNNCNVPQEAVTPTRRDMTTNLVTTSLDWVPVSEYNTRSNCNQSRKPSNNTSDHELTDLDNSVAFESGFGRFVPVRPQPRALPLTVQNRENVTTDHHDDGASASVSHTLQPYAHQMQNGLNPHSNHAAAAVMIVNPTTPNAITGNMSQQFNVPNQNRSNLNRNLNSARNSFEVNNHTNNNNSSASQSSSRSVTKSVNLTNNMYEQGQGSFNNVNETNHVNRESARALGEAIVAACPDAAAVERRLGQIREYIRVTSSLVDTMRNSEDEAFIEHTKEEYDELIQMVMKLKESEKKLQDILSDNTPENVEVPIAEVNEISNEGQCSDTRTEGDGISLDKTTSQDKSCHHKNLNDTGIININLKKVTNIENEQLNKTMSNIKSEELQIEKESNISYDIPERENSAQNTDVHIEEIQTLTYSEVESRNDGQNLNETMKKNILSCLEKVALIEEMRNKTKDTSNVVTDGDKVVQDVVVRPVSVQSNGSAYSENEIWQNEIKNKMEMSQIRLEALKQQQKRLLKYQAEAKAQLEEINKERQNQDISIPSTSHDGFGGMQNLSLSANYHQANRMYAANQIGVATTLPQSSEVLHATQQMTANNIESEHSRSTRSNHSHDERFSIRDGNVASSEEAAAGGRDSEADDDESVLNERSRILQMKLRELQMKKQHMENLVTEFQKLQLVARLPSSHNTYSSSGEDSGDDEPSRKCNKSTVNNKNEDPFKLMEIKAIRTALQKTKDLMRSVENYESEQLSGVHEDSFAMQGHSNIHDNKSEGGGSMGGWSNEGSVCRVRNSLPQRHKFTNEQHSQQLQQHQMQQLQQQQMHQQQLHQQQLQQQQLQQQQMQQQLQQQQMQQQQLQQQQMQQQQMQQQQLQQQQLQQQQLPQHPQHQQQNHETNINTLQELAQELRLETEKIMGERARIKDLVANKEGSRKQKKVNEEVRAVGPAETRQMQLRALLADKQRELEALLNKEKVMCAVSESQNRNPDSHTASVVNQSYNSEQEEPESRSEHITMDSQNLRENENFRGGGDSALGSRSINTVPSHLGSTYGSDSDSASRNKSNQRTRMRRRQTQERQSEENNAVQMQTATALIPNVRHEARSEASASNMPPSLSQNNETSTNSPYPHLPPPCWNSSKSNQDTRSNQFTQNSHSQTMERLLGTPQMSFPPTMPFNMMMPYGMVGACGCGCALWGAWCWQQLALQQQEINQLREQLTHLEERWRVETATHTLNNQVPPGNRANNYWDNFRSYSRQNLLSTNNKTNADGHLGISPAHNQQPLVERSHNTLHHTSSSTSPSITPKRNTNAAPPVQSGPSQPLPAAYERSLSFSSAPDVLNVNQNADPEPNISGARNEDAAAANININRQDPSPHSFRNLSITNPIPEIIQSHSNNLNSTGNAKRKSSSKLPSKNTANRRNYSLDFSQTSNINIASTSETPNPNLASTSREVQDKATSKLFDLLRENVYSEVTTLIGVNESHPDFLIQLFRELQLISSDPLRQKVLQSIRNILSQYSSISESNQNDNAHEEIATEVVTTTSSEVNNYHDCSNQNACSSTIQIDSKIVHFLLVKSGETFSAELLESLASLIVNGSDGRQHRRLLDFLSKYEGLRVCDVSGDIIENLPLFIAGSNDADESTHLTSEVSESSILQDVAGSLNLFSSSETQLHQMNACPYDMWSGHVHMEVDGRDSNDNSPRSSQDGKMDLINCSEMHNGDLAEADQTCPLDEAEAATSGQAGELAVNTDVLPDVVETEEVTPTEAEAEWIGLDRVPTRLHVDETSEKQKD